jgi:kynurenine formamidase
MIDLSLPIANGMPVYPGDMEPRIQRLDTPSIIEAGWVAHWMTISLHAATHIEAPAHSVEGGKMLDEFPLESFSGEATTIAWGDIGHYKVNTPMLFVYSGADKWWGNQKYFSPTPLTELEAEWIASLNIRILGMDIISVGNVNIHRMLQIKNILLAESMCNLEMLLYKRAKAYLFPLRIKDTEASPVRAVAEIL